jgi:hypothetical protein
VQSNEFSVWIGRNLLLRVNVVQNTIEQQHQVIGAGLQIIVKGKLLKDWERRQGNAALRTQAGDQRSVVQTDELAYQEYC